MNYAQEVELNMVNWLPNSAQVQQQAAVFPKSESNPEVNTSDAYSLFMNTQEKMIFNELVGIIDNFADRTGWNNIITATANTVKTMDINNLSSYNLPLQSGNPIGPWLQVSAAMYSDMQAQNDINIAKNNNLLNSGTQNAYLYMLLRVCNTALRIKGDIYSAYSETTFQQWMTDINNNVSILSNGSYKTLNTYLLHVKSYIRTYANANDDQRRAFLFCYRPFLVALYISRFIMTTNAYDAFAKDKPSGLMIQVISMFVFRVYILQTALLIMNVLSKTNAGSAGLTQMSNVIQFERSMINQMFDSNNDSSYYSELTKMLQENKTNSASLKDTVLKLDMAKGNLEKAVTNDIIVNKELKKSFAWMYTWMSLFILTVVVLGVLVLMANNDKRQLYFLITFSFAGAMSLIVLVVFFVKMIRS
jgi:hypothetical protein